MRFALVFLCALGCGGGNVKASDPSSSEAKEVKPTTPEERERYNNAIAYRNRSVDAQNAGDWQAARAALQECVEALHEPNCERELADLESRHRF